LGVAPTPDSDTRASDTRDSDTRDSDTRDSDTRDSDTRDSVTRDSVTPTSLPGTAKVSANRVVSPRAAGSEAPAPGYAWTLNSAVRVERVCLHWLSARWRHGAAIRLGRRMRACAKPRVRDRWRPDERKGDTA
jgi:hypothetical protein